MGVQAAVHPPGPEVSPVPGSPLGTHFSPTPRVALWTHELTGMEAFCVPPPRPVRDPQRAEETLSPAVPTGR